MTEDMEATVVVLAVAVTAVVTSAPAIPDRPWAATSGRCRGGSGYPKADIRRPASHSEIPVHPGSRDLRYCMLPTCDMGWLCASVEPGYSS